MLPEQIKKFIEDFSKLPSIGPRQAARLAFFLISRDKTANDELTAAISGLKELKICLDCFFVHAGEKNLCSTCRDPERNKKVIMIVEKETQLISLEKTKKYAGLYLVLGEMEKNATLSASQKTRLNRLKERAKENGKFTEIIIATNPTSYGDLSALLIKKELSETTEKFTRLGRGIPTGGEIEFADEETLGEALNRRI